MHVQELFVVFLDDFNEFAAAVKLFVLGDQGRAGERVDEVDDEEGQAPVPVRYL